MSRDKKDKPKIFLYCRPLYDDVKGVALAEDGTCLASHISSNPEFSKMDLQSEWHQPKYKAHYPSGFELEWVDSLETHAAFNRAFDLWTKARDAKPYRR